MRTIGLQDVLSGLLLAILLAPAPADAQDRHETALGVIVKFRSSADGPAKRGLTLDAERAERAEALALRAGVALRLGASVAPDVDVVRGAGADDVALAALLARDPEVEYAEPDARMYPLASPNDPLYLTGPPLSPPGAPTSGGPAAGQWYLRAPDGQVQSSSNVAGAWNLVTDASAIVVAVLDTGARFDHPDLGRAANGGSFLPGYDMIALATLANDGDGRDGDATDPGDWVTAAELADTAGGFRECLPQPRNSSWHGTLVGGLIGALTGNGIGMAGVAPKVRLLPVRVLGKCTGLVSDIVAGMRWAAGLPVPGVPDNPTPARVLNMSLGAEAACGKTYADAVAAVNAAGALIVAAAGNEAGHAVGAPANCPGVVAVAGLRHFGSKVSFSSLGPEIALSAPGGNCVETGPGSVCRYPILSASNAGLSTPVDEASGGATYTDSFRVSAGTSFSAPLVAGTAAMMLSVQPALQPAEAIALLKATARAFPVTGSDTGASVPMCVPPQPIGAPQVVQQECYCTAATCGAGMLDAAAAVRAALDSAAVPVVEFYHPALDHYFITWVPAEIASLDSGASSKGWTRTGKTFRTYSGARTGTSPVCRFYIPPGLGDSHYFGRGTAECSATGARNPTFVNEDPAFMQMLLPSAGVCPPATTPVYRVFSNRPDANHRYMIERSLRDEMVARGWLAEGDGPDQVVMCSPA